METTIDEAIATNAFVRDPYPIYRRLLSLDSPYFSQARGGWLISHFDDVVNAFRDWENFSSEERVANLVDHLSEEDADQLHELRRWSSLKGIIHSDPPGHSELRSILAKAFTRRVVEQLRPDVERLVTQFLDEAVDQGEIDVVGGLAARLPAAVISEMLGVPSEDRIKFVAWSDDALALQGNQRASFEVARDAQEAYINLQRYFSDLLDDRRRNPREEIGREDLLTSLLKAADEADGIDEPILIQTCITLLMGGFETTTSLISNTVLLLLQHPGALAKLRDNPDQMHRTIEESLRYESPIQSVTRRVTSDVAMNGEVLRKGDLAVFMIGAANRDPRQFADPDRFDTSRTNRHIAFGFGIHFCLGAPLARLEAPVAVKAMLDRFPDLELAQENANWDINKPLIRCPSELRVSI